MGKKKQTAGEKMVDAACAKCATCRLCPYGRIKLARCIDAAIKRQFEQAVRDAKRMHPITHTPKEKKNGQV